MIKRFLSLFIILGVLFSPSFKAQSLEETLSNLSSTVGRAYVKPVISAFGSNLNSGWVSQFPSQTLLGFYLDLKIVAMGSFFTDDLKNFSTSGDFYFSAPQVDMILQGSNYTPATIGQSNYDNLKQQIIAQQFTVNFSGPTIIGSKSDFLKVQFPGKTVTAGTNTYTVLSYYLPVNQVKGFLDGLPALPTAAAQLTVGTVFGTNVAIRYLPDIEIQNMGKFSYFGAGIIHNPGVWFPNPLPIDLTVGFFTQKLKVGSIFESTATQMGLYASKTFGWGISITPYAGVTTETSKTTVTYDYTSNQTLNGVPVKAKINMDMEGENSASFVVGLNIHLGILNLNADYKLAKTNTASAGVSFGF